MPTKRRKAQKAQPHKWIISVFLLLIVIILGAGVGMVIGAVVNVPPWSPEKLYGSRTTILYDKNFEPYYSLHAEENRVQVPLDKIPPDLIHAFIAVEDQDFYKHHGVNFVSIARAVLVDIITGKKSQGASTITQQLAKNAFLSPEKSWERKIKEAVIAVQLENKYSKDEILEFYVNRIYFGAGAWGVETAAQTYFGKNVGDLSLAESSLLAGLAQSPNNYSPYRNYDLAKKRQETVLRRMVACGYITQSEADAAYDAQLHFKKPIEGPQHYGFFVDYVIDEADEILSEEGYFENTQDALFKGGLKIYTTMNPSVQSYAEDFYSNSSNFPPGKENDLVQSAMVILSQKNGDVIAMMGGRNYTQQRGLNRAVDSYRQPGSSIKPLVVYGPALEDGKSPDYIIDDSPVSFGSWSPKNSDGKFRGKITMRTAVQFSVNVCAVKLANEIGIRKGIKFAKSLGITSLVDGDYNLSTALGGITKGVCPLEMASAYGAFGNEGVWFKPHVITKIEDNSGNTLYEYRPQSKRAMKKETAYLMTSMLETVVQAGTGTRAKISGVDCAGKTGTTSEEKDAWFVGYTPYYSCAVWMGYDKGKNRIGTYGGTYPARAWKAIMSKAISGKSSKSFASGVQMVAVCTKSGRLATPACPESDIEMKMQSDDLPTEKCDLHVLVGICGESGKLANPYCPNKVSQGFLKDALPGEEEAAPIEYCDIHTSPTQSSTVYVCRDSRNEGRLYRAVIPLAGESGGCPSEYLEQVQVDDPNNVPICPLPDHQITY
ncbi:MAG: transglycosylase domain-containing protein [Chitinophagales bacterium]